MCVAVDDRSCSLFWFHVYAELLDMLVLAQHGEDICRELLCLVGHGVTVYHNLLESKLDLYSFIIFCIIMVTFNMMEGHFDIISLVSSVNLLCQIEFRCEGNVWIRVIICYMSFTSKGLRQKAFQPLFFTVSSVFGSAWSCCFCQSDPIWSADYPPKCHCKSFDWSIGDCNEMPVYF